MTKSEKKVVEAAMKLPDAVRADEVAEKVVGGHVFNAAHEVYDALKQVSLAYLALRAQARCPEGWVKCSTEEMETTRAPMISDDGDYVVRWNRSVTDRLCLMKFVLPPLAAAPKSGEGK